jgi:hypothetical protein
LWIARDIAPVAGQEVSILGVKDLTQYLFVHAARHCWERWKWLGDIAALCRRFSAKQIEEYREAADELGNLAIFDSGLLMMTSVTGFQLPGNLAQKVHSDTRAERVAKRSFRLLMRRSPEDSDRGQRYFLRQLIERLRLKPNLSCVLYETAVLAHRPEDWYTNRLPDYMMWANYVLRFVSLFRRGIGRSQQTD